MNASQVLAQEKATYPKVAAPCPYFGTCGGCTLQDLAYPDQLALKRERIRQAFAPLGTVPEFELVGLDDPWRYRNKAELTFGQVNGALVLGYHAARSFWKIVDLDDCLLLPEPLMRVARWVLAFARASGLPAYHPKTHQGFFRYLLLRYSRATEALLVCPITTTGHSDVMERLAHELSAHEPQVSSVYWGVTNRLADIALPETLTCLAGSPYLEEQIGAFRMQCHPLSFLQPSSQQAERLYARLARMVGELPSGVAWDLYCGMGLIAFSLAGQARKVYAIDTEAHHLELAALNAARNGLSNIEFRLGRVEELLLERRFWLQEAKPDVIVVDPPRAGLHPKVIPSLLAARPLRLAYVSCNVQSLVRDLRLLLSGFPRYRLTQLEAFDMFPQTNHAELLALLERC